MDLEPGDQFSAEVASVIRSGLGTVRHEGDMINIGPVTCQKGTKVQLQYLGEKEEHGQDVGFALCLTEEVLAPDHTEWIRGIMDHLIPDEPPESGVVSYAEIDDIEERDLGVTILGGERIQLGPVRAEVGSLVRIVGIGDGYAKVQTESARGKNYMTRLSILAGWYYELPISEGDEITTTISDLEGETLIGYVGDVPVRFVSGEAEVGQKIDGRIVGFDRDTAIGEITETYDEVGRIDHASHWARMQWLKKAGLEPNPFRTFASEFIGTTKQALPERGDQLRDALIAEAIRLGLENKTNASTDEYPKTHISGLRHWVVHKLGAILGDPKPDDGDDESDWFRAVMSERTGPTVTFYGDLLQLAQGYYAPAPTRAIMTTETEAILVSGKASQQFLDAGLELEFRGITRVITNTSTDELSAADITLQSQDAYVGISDSDLFTESDLRTFIQTRSQEEWQPETDWEPYTGHRYGFEPDGTPLVATIDGDIQASFWRVPVEYGTDAYQLKIEPGEEPETKMVGIPTQYRKQVCLILNAADGVPQQVEITGDDNAVVVNCDFAPPRPQMRWLHAIGAQWIDSPTYQLQWQIPPESANSVSDVFAELPVTLTNKIAGET